jgi:hypothetical protein
LLPIFLIFFVSDFFYGNLFALNRFFLASRTINVGYCISLSSRFSQPVCWLAFLPLKNRQRLNCSIGPQALLQPL